MCHPGLLVCINVKNLLINNNLIITIRDLAEKIARVMRFEGLLNFDRTKPEGQLIKLVHSLTFEKYFPNFEFTSFEEGLKQTVAWFEHNHAKQSS